MSMKKYILFGIAFLINVCSAYGKIELDQNTNDHRNIQYSFGAIQLNKSNYIYNIRVNVQDYLEGKRRNGWSYDYVLEFQDTYNRYIKALDDPNDPYRFYTDEFGTLYDQRGQFQGRDFDDFWYDNKGNKITGVEYRSLKEKKKQKYRQFNASGEVVTYFYKVGKKLADYKAKKEREAATKRKAATQRKSNSEYVGW